MSTSASRMNRVHVGWIMPPFMHELPVDANDSDDAARRLKDIAVAVLPNRGEEDQYTFALQLGNQLEPMKAAGVTYAGLCFLEVNGEPTTSTITVSQVAHGQDEATLLPTIEKTLSLRYRHDEIQQSTLPCGRCITRIGPAPFQFEDVRTGETQRVERTLLQVYLPLPDTGEMMIFELSVPSAEGWDLHSDLFAEILKTVDWTTDEEIAQQQEIAGIRRYGDPGNTSVADDFG
jgi:hypothetical protein